MAGRRWLLGLACGVAAGTITAADWPQWRGPTRDNKATDFKVPATWPKELKQHWKVKVGNGVSSPLLVGDKLYTFGRVGDEEVVTCLNAETGKEIWTDKYKADPVTGPGAQFPGTRSTPAIGDGMLVTFGVDGTISCYDAATGKRAWRKEKTGKPGFFTACSPLIADGLVVINVGGDGQRGGPAGALTAFDLKSGDEKWKGPTEGAKYGSPVLLTADGVKQVVTLVGQALIGVGLADGKLLWRVPLQGNYQSGTPIVDGSTVYCTTVEQGTVALKVVKKGDKFEAEQLWKSPRAAGTYNTPVLKEGMLYGMGMPPRAGAGGPPAGGQPPGGGRGGGRGGGMGGGGQGPLYFYAMDAKTGDVKWTDDVNRDQGGGIIDVGSVLLALTSAGDLVVFKPGDKFEQVAKYKVADGKTYTIPIVTGNKIYVKDRESSIALWTIE
jgi:outer membrane protein assembly factor BamB